MITSWQRTINSQESLDAAIKELCEAWKEHKYLTISYNTKKRRTLTQNAAMHVYFKLLADNLNGAGYDQRKLLKETVDMPWSEHSVKEFLWRPIQKAITEKDSTAKLNTQEISEVYEVINRHTAQKLGISVPWPEVAQDE